MIIGKLLPTFCSKATVLPLLSACLFLFVTKADAQKEKAIPNAGVEMTKGTWFAGGTLSTGFRNAKEEKQLLTYIVSQNKNDFEVRGDIGYIFRQNVGVGMGLVYGRTNETSTLKNSDGVLTDRKAAGDFYAFRPFIKNFLPLGNSKQFYVVIPTELQIGFGNKLKEETTNNVLTRSYVKSQFYGLALRPGILAFIHKNFGFEVTVGAFGLNTTVEKTTTTGQPNSVVTSGNLDLRINILNLSLGLVGYF